MFVVDFNEPRGELRATVPSDDLERDFRPGTNRDDAKGKSEWRLIEFASLFRA